MSLSTDTEEEGTASKLSLAAEREESVAHHQTERAASQVASCVSMKSDHSMVDPSCSSGESPSNPEENTQRAASPVPSCVSMKSDISMKIPPDFSDEKPFNPREKTQRAASPVPSCVSMKSDISMKISPDLSDEKPSFNPRENTQRTSSPVPSCVSMKSDISMKIPPDLSDEKPSFNPIRETTQIAASEVPSCVSMKSDISMKIPLDFSVEKPPSEEREGLVLDQSKSGVCELVPNDPIQQQNSYQPVDNVLQLIKARHKSSMKTKYKSLSEGLKIQENKTLLKEFYTQLYIIEGQSEGVNKEHEVLQIEKISWKHLKDKPIDCNDIFVNIPEQSEKIKAALTKGIAGIGKTVSVHKFILDWTEGKANKDVDFMFLFPFRELNLIRNDQYSLHSLLVYFYPELQGVDSKIYDKCKVVFIFDGLDESRIPLKFLDCEKVSVVTVASSVDVLMTNLIKGELLPSALIWITSRPAATNQIPPQYINRVTEVEGFNDPQKEEYFRKRVPDEHQAEKIISHIKTTRSLHIMCHIPVFCWISATVLQKILEEDDRAEIPKSLTEMYIHFLLIQTNVKHEKFDKGDESDLKKLLQSNREVILKLTELAFKQLMKGNIMFYDEDLRECGIDITEASVYCGLCTEIFKEESVLNQRKVYSFIHLSFQEFFSALYVFLCFASNNMQAVHSFLADDEELNKTSEEDGSEKDSLYKLQKAMVDKALQNENGHLDLFLRFFLGISLDFNQSLLEGLLTHTQKSSGSIEKTIKYITDSVKDVRNEYVYPLYATHHVSSERYINLFLCLLEMRDQSLHREIQELLKSDERSDSILSAAHCSAMAYILQMSGEVLHEFDLKKFNTSEEGARRLVPVVMNCRKALFVNGYLTEQSCKIMATALQAANSPLRELDLHNNEVQDSGMKLLLTGLMSPECNLEIFGLACCKLSDQSCEAMASALQSETLPLRELDLSNNNLQDSGVNLISAGLVNNPNCKLEILRLAMCNLTHESCEVFASGLQSESLPLRELDLSNNDLQDSGVNLISAGLKNPHCKLELLRLSGCLVTVDGCSYLASALISNPSHLIELDLSYNHPGDTGVKLLSARLQDPHCKLKRLNVDHDEEFRITPGIRKYTCELTLDPNTAHMELSLSEGDRQVTHVKEKQSYPDHPERFEQWRQVISRESLSGRYYWEAELSGFRADIAVTYKGIIRKGEGNNCVFGYNDKSWNLNCFKNNYCAWHDHNYTDIPAPISLTKRVGVYLDWLAGTLSFYSISPDTRTLTHLHTFYSPFTEPLYAGFGVSSSWVRLCPRTDVFN
ncbi:NACHT, LRR and PYD domains-containing protein 12-like isoform X1 [Alosa sapidissima]|uniref:NACHT, LRR and PYD domains-containing protein 12-like isoform X1 n=2 Tax=Alosa sapidissima TaxID=34773 RepID=UPI001C0878C4|nr:NACHT, LRR and PYD domains-containing protein 12-like isoform X1 [Alosa sapidissima]XP_041946145.1 NACHT, LRR and PYD domains-containing protein 12-like isoform X1 [Alosa sapidissima]